MQEFFAVGFCFEARGAVRHDASTLGGADLAAEVRFAGLAEFAFAAFGGAGGLVRTNVSFLWFAEGREGERKVRSVSGWRDG